jgi:hypothetical protein
MGFISTSVFEGPSEADVDPDFWPGLGPRDSDGEVLEDISV